MARIYAIALVGALLGGCAGNPNALKNAGVDVNQGEVTLGVATTIEAGRMIQAIVNPYTSADVDHLHVELAKLVSGSYVTVASQDTEAGSGITKTVNFAHLKMNSTYKITVGAITAAGANINKAGSGTATLTTTNDDFVPVSVSVALADKTFDGSTHPVVSVTDGAVNDTSSAEAGSVADNN